MKRINLVVAAILIGLAVALTYFCFEWIVRVAIDTVWNDFLHVDEHKWRVVPICVGLTLLYFGSVHLLDRKSESKESHGLGEAPMATLRNFATIIAIGFLSLLAGASLGPEAILVPACIVAGGIVGRRVLGLSGEPIRYAAALGFVALLAAFFNSFLTGMLALLLIRKQLHFKPGMYFVILSAVTSLTVVGTLHLVEGESYVADVGSAWAVEWSGALWLVAIAAACYGLAYLFKLIYDVAEKAVRPWDKCSWWQRALVAGAGLAVLYLATSPLIWFTGSESIQPLIAQSATLGLGGLLVICATKLIAMAWSKASGYRGGLIFPLVLVVAAVVSAAQLYSDGFGFAIGVVAGLIGALMADRKLGVLL